jgi:acyl-CoA reductase-like NAD-dependent aldehyde dehydrogenase
VVPCGSSSPSVLLDDLEGAELETAVTKGIGSCYINSGQACAALTRMLVPRHMLATVERLATDAAEAFRPGDPFDPETTLGPLVSDVQRERVRGYIRKGVEDGATLLTGGDDPPEGLETGYFVRPTVFTDVLPDMTIAQEEIFGPVIVLMPYDSEAEAVEIANGTAYGLSGGVYAADRERAFGAADRAGAHQRGHLEPAGAVRRLQAVRQRP